MMQAESPTFMLLAVAAAALLMAIWQWISLARARRRARAAEQLAATRARYLSLAAQDLRGPGLALNALATPAGTPEKSALEAIAQQVLRLADDLAAFANEASPRRLSLHDAPAPIGAVVDSAIAKVAAQIRPGRRHWQVDPGLRALTVRADPRALEGAIAALLRRAARHSHDGDVITLRHVVACENIAIVIEDEGDGLTAEDLVAEASGPPSGTRGLDLGLSLARSLAAAHGGDIRLEAAPGIGARAWLTLPRTRLLAA